MAGKIFEFPHCDWKVSKESFFTKISATVKNIVDISRYNFHSSYEYYLERHGREVCDQRQIRQQIFSLSNHFCVQICCQVTQRDSWKTSRKLNCNIVESRFIRICSFVYWAGYWVEFYKKCERLGLKFSYFRRTI